MNPRKQESRWSAAPSQKTISVSRFYLDEVPAATLELQGDCFLEKFLGNYTGQLSIVNAAFCELEERFISERESLARQPGKTYSVSTTHDSFMLQLRRNNLAATLCREMKPQLEAYIVERSRMAVELPEVADTWDAELAGCLGVRHVA